MKPPVHIIGIDPGPKTSGVARLWWEGGDKVRVIYVVEADNQLIRKPLLPSMASFANKMGESILLALEAYVPFYTMGLAQVKSGLDTRGAHDRFVQVAEDNGMSMISLPRPEILIGLGFPAFRKKGEKIKKDDVVERVKLLITGDCIIDDSTQERRGHRADAVAAGYVGFFKWRRECQG